MLSSNDFATELAALTPTVEDALPSEALFSETGPKVERVSVDAEGNEVLGFASSASLSGDGRFVAFSETADGLVADDTNQASDIFVRDRLTGSLERVSTLTDAAATLAAYNPVISEDGRFVAFQTQTAETSETAGGVYLYDRETEETEQISVNDAEEAANRAATNADISADGRFVVFQSDADNLVEGDTNEASDIFVRDRQLNTTVRLSLALDGTQGNGASSQAVISADGRFVAFSSDASNLVENDTNNTADIFVYDLETQTVERISVASDGTEGDGFSRAPSLSADGRYVSYDSLATNLVADDTNGKGDVFVYDRETQTTERVSISSEGEESNNFAFNHDISSDGRYVSYSSGATNLVENDTNRVVDVFVFDRETQTTQRISTNAEGVQGNRESRESVFSADGEFIAFQSSADSLVDDDTNGRTDIFVYDFDPQPAPEPPANEDAITLDLTELETSMVTASIEVTRSAGYENTVGWYVVEDAQGGVRDELTGEVLNPGDEGYMQAAIAQRIDLALTGINGQTVFYEIALATDTLLSTFIVSNGTIESLLDADPLNDPNVFFGHLGANSDGEKHVELLAENTFGYEDLLGGGDRDFNDMIVEMSFA